MYDCLSYLARILLMVRQRRFTFQEALNHEDQKPNDNNGTSEEEAQVAITPGNATYYDNPFQQPQKKKYILHHNLELLMLLNMKWIPSKFLPT